VAAVWDSPALREHVRGCYSTFTGQGLPYPLKMIKLAVSIPITEHTYPVYVDPLIFVDGSSRYLLETHKEPFGEDARRISRGVVIENSFTS
jgi:hypothetical protein